MEITRKVHDQRPDGAVDQTITIRIRPDDDPYGVINGLIVRGRLEKALRILALGGDHVDALTPHEAREVLAGAAWVAQRAGVELDRAMWACKDSLGMSWRDIATAADADISWVRRHVAKLRSLEAETGRWRTPAGLHRGTPAEALGHLAHRADIE